jgi:hypothetical protein
VLLALVVAGGVAAAAGVFGGGDGGHGPGPGPGSTATQTGTGGGASGAITQDEAQSVIDSFTTAWNNQDTDGMAALMTDNAEAIWPGQWEGGSLEEAFDHQLMPLDDPAIEASPGPFEPAQGGHPATISMGVTVYDGEMEVPGGTGDLVFELVRDEGEVKISRVDHQSSG